MSVSDVVDTRRALEAVEARAEVPGTRRVRLHVFGHNRAVRTLYEKLGYEATSIVMSKRLDGSR